MIWKALAGHLILVASLSVGLEDLNRPLKNVAGGPATGTAVVAPGGLAIDRDGNLLILETLGLRVRKLDVKNRTIITVIGTGKRCCFVEGKPATAAALQLPQAIALDAAGDILVADSVARLYRVDSKSGMISTVVRQTWSTRDPSSPDLPHLPGGESIVRVAASSSDPHAPLYLLSSYGKIYSLIGKSISEFLGGEELRELHAWQLFSPSGMVVDSLGNLVIADKGSCRILRIDTSSKSFSVLGGTGGCKAGAQTGAANTVALNHPSSVTLDSADNVYFSSGPPYCVGRIDAHTNLLTSIPGTCDARAGKTWAPSAVAVDTSGNIYIAMWHGNVVKKVDGTTGEITTVAGNGLPDVVVNPVD